MSREITADFKNLIVFFKKYSLNNVIGKGEFTEIISSVHKKYFSYLTIVSELETLKNDLGITPNISQEQIEFIKESCSDIGNSFFTLINGSYKPSKLMLRSSIETFLKGYNLDIYPGITTEKSLYKIFDTLKAHNFYQLEPQKAIFELIHQTYGDLCADTHTATTLNMSHITSMNYFPKFDIQNANEVRNTLIKLVTSYISLIVLKYNSHYFKMHHRNRENILNSIPGNIKRKIQGIE